MTKKATAAAPVRSRLRHLTEKVRTLASGARSHALRSARVQQAVDCGKALFALKAVVERGCWSQWLEKHCAVNRMTANRYMRLSGRATQVTPRMTLRKAYLAAGVIKRAHPNPRRIRKTAARRRRPTRN